jgi:hypothetical protein
MSRSRPLTRNQLAAFLPNHEAVKAFERLMDEAYVQTPADLTALVASLEETNTETATASAKADSALAILASIAQSLELLALAPVDVSPYLASIAQSLELLASAPSVQLGTVSPLNAPGSGNAGSKEVVLGSDTRLSDVRLPTGPAFSAYQNVAQALLAATFTKILFQVEEYDTNNNFASSTFTPTVAGYYQLSASISVGTTACAVFFYAYKNGAIHKNLGGVGGVVGAASGSCLVYMNGTTDYLEAFAYFGIAQNTNPGIAFTYFQAALVRAA